MFESINVSVIIVHQNNNYITKKKISKNCHAQKENHVYHVIQSMLKSLISGSPVVENCSFRKKVS